MPTLFNQVAANPLLFSEIVRATFYVDPTLTFYGAAAVVLTVLWTVGCLTFGRAA
jgi:hypothetical protein